VERKIYKVIFSSLIFIILFSLPAEANSPLLSGSTTTALTLSDDGDAISFPVTLGISGSMAANLLESLGIKCSVDLGWTESSLTDGAFEEVNGPLFAYIFNISELFLTYNNDKLQIKAGRFTFSEPSGKIFSQNADGVQLNYSAENIRYTIFGNYTGLQWKNQSTVFLSSVDEYYAAREESLFAAPRMVLSVMTDFIAFDVHSVYLSFLMQKDLRYLIDSSLLINSGDSREDAGIGGLVDTYYFSAGSSGRITDLISYSLFGILETGKSLICPVEGENKDIYSEGSILAYSAGASLSFVLPSLMGSMLQIEGAYSSGDNDKSTVLEGNTRGYDEAYIPVSSITIGTVLPFEFGNTWYTDLSWMVFPFRNSENFMLSRMLLKSQLRALFRSTVGPISEYGLESSSLSPYLGIETGLLTLINLLSDLSLSAGVNIFFPGFYPSGAFDAEYNDGRIAVFSGSLSLKLSF
jgi:hypothetical protein